MHGIAAETAGEERSALGMDGGFCARPGTDGDGRGIDDIHRFAAVVDLVGILVAIGQGCSSCVAVSRDGKEPRPGPIIDIRHIGPATVYVVKVIVEAALNFEVS